MLRQYISRMTCIKHVTCLNRKTFTVLPVRHVRGFGGSRTGKSLGLGSRNVESRPESNKIQLVKPFFFSLGVSGVSFAGAAIWQYESLRREAQSLMKGVTKNFENKWRKAGGTRDGVNQWWNNLSSAEKLTWGIISLNAAVLIGWRVPALQSAMIKYFTSNPFKEARCVSMVLSTFSHQSFFHIAANMYVLMSFSSIVCQLLGKEQFLAMYLSAGVFSSLASYAAKVIRPTMVPSLGASGAIMAVLGATCMAYPDTRLAIAFVGDILPHSFSASGAMKGMIIFDTVGLILGWKMLDHAAHLGGMAFGIWYVSYGREWIWSNRAEFMKVWHKFRSIGNDKG